jgi:hypothetical protein
MWKWVFMVVGGCLVWRMVCAGPADNDPASIYLALATVVAGCMAQWDEGK